MKFRCVDFAEEFLEFYLMEQFDTMFDEEKETQKDDDKLREKIAIEDSTALQSAVIKMKLSGKRTSRVKSRKNNIIKRSSSQTSNEEA